MCRSSFNDTNVGAASTGSETWSIEIVTVSEVVMRYEKATHDYKEAMLYLHNSQEFGMARYA